MVSLQLYQPESVEEATSLLAQHGDGVKIIAGGTAVVIMLNNRLISPAGLVSLGRLAALRSIRHEPGTGLRIGAMTPIRTAELSDLVRAMNPTLASTYAKVANVRVRNAATVGGNLTEADYASDPPCLLVAMRARVRVASARGEREIPLTEFFKDFYETSIQPDEVLTELIVPEQAPTARSAYLKFVTRSSEDRPCVGTAAVVEMRPDGTCNELRVVVGAVASTPQEVPHAEALARGQRLTDELISEIAAAHAASIDPLADLRGSARYRKQMIHVFVRRAIHAALADMHGRA
jgi:carbon-monoxide dehydrogenase medium subunit